MKRWVAIVVVLVVVIATIGVRSWWKKDDTITASGTLEARNVSVGFKNWFVFLTQTTSA